EERVSRNFLLEGDYDLILNVIDGTQIERQLYLTIEVLSLKKPMILVINMMDEVRESGKTIDTERLSSLLGIPVVAVTARTGEGIAELHDLIIDQIDHPTLSLQRWERKDLVYLTIRNVAEIIRGLHVPEFKALKYLEHDEETEKEIASSIPEALDSIEKLREDLERKTRRTGDRAVSDWIFGICHGLYTEVVKNIPRPESRKKRILAGIDKAALSRFTGIPLFFIVLFIMFQITFSAGDFIIGLLELGLKAITHLFEGMKNPLIESFLVDGVLGGVGNVLLLTPYVGIMFLILSFLEDSGYMARAAFVMDRFMHRLGLHGKAFIPLVMGFGCNVPAIMAARTLETQHER
ncbi:MAG TPA: ferrous iron transporter B, partial [Spirochaetia bacterium]|nr:ferrous iron transporter B [Spirochaetia bacterium]